MSLFKGRQVSESLHKKVSESCPIEIVGKAFELSHNKSFQVKTDFRVFIDEGGIRKRRTRSSRNFGNQFRSFGELFEPSFRNALQLFNEKCLKFIEQILLSLVCL